MILIDGCARGTGATWTPALVDFTGGSHGVGHRNVGEPWFSSHGGGGFGSVHLPEFEGTSVPDQRGERPDTWPPADQKLKIRGYYKISKSQIRRRFHQNPPPSRTPE